MTSAIGSVTSPDAVVLPSAGDGNGVWKSTGESGDLDAWLTSHREALIALGNGDTIIRNDASGRASVLIPMTCGSTLEGVVCVRNDSPLPETVLDALRRLCRKGARILAGLRQSEAEREALSFALHELATPIAASRGYARMILEGQVGAITETQREYLSTVLDNLNRLVRAIAGLRDGASR